MFGSVAGIWQIYHFIQTIGKHDFIPVTAKDTSLSELHKSSMRSLNTNLLLIELSTTLFTTVNNDATSTVMKTNLMQKVFADASQSVAVEITCIHRQHRYKADQQSISRDC